jgi:hypothetical protein
MQSNKTNILAFLHSVKGLNTINYCLLVRLSQMFGVSAETLALLIELSLQSNGGLCNQN